MDENPLIIDENKKMLLEKELTNALFEAAKKNTITLAEIKYIAEEILLDFKKITNHEELVVFLDKITLKWSFFSGLLIKYKAEDKKVEEKKVIEKLSNFIKNTK